MNIQLQYSSLKVIDLFSGCGGLSLGFQNYGFEISAAFENWKPAINVYQQNFNHPIIEYDLSQVNNDYSIFKKFLPDVIIGGPPCQDFSSAGKRNEDLGRGDLSITFAEIVANVASQWFVIENVDLFRKSNKYQEFRQILKSAGYGLTEKVLDASLCGVPQKRKRFFCIGELGGKDGNMETYLEANLSRKPITIRDYLGTSLGVEYYYRHPRSYQRRAIFSIDEPSPTIRGVNRPIPKNYKQHPGDVARVTPDLRPLTTRERSYIQTFPEDFILAGSKTDLEQMIGNAVPVKLAEYVAKCLMMYIQESKKSPIYNICTAKELEFLHLTSS
ncbi:DNA cytosine methyltransferase [Anabaena cylindrica FACHB-243]|uniref:Cytosine-specific methyltransferase n=1 Tax=Anabaena cylindrica (strain ATCC 27899 / PCC 7122) TaxID=272123 RepID=K9ZCS6_ANACC|nr:MULTISPECIES: DNA cytosine methyltransferase [Anabaena]AFZ56524.1 DNA-cytosine methyltransferase [Anabaena cylindrica PCC 7122]MBD2418560.1 DNA cytosine methyltransferase [Anabaena cylindrica FACHB-243]MBY5285704.1 DNA cytosine methyltransferase [Anabaena sp. CCAP 1446/1C]MBY5311496.1 DNA cytosine methyltransferase [Anabaena sp. CCAP 1446/1C]MCM2409925.1 DNA cytosine methyltransferase [Anabaena sp. CCAP 1446/1C]